MGADVHAKRPEEGPMPRTNSNPRTRRSWRMLAPMALLVLFVALSRGYAEPRDDWSLEARLPQSALGVLTIDNVGALEERLNKTAIAGLFNEPEMKAFMEPIEKSFNEALEAGEDGPLGEQGPMMLKLIEQMKGLNGQVAVALLDVNVEEEMPVMAASMDFGTKISEFVTFVQTMRAEMDPDGKAVREFEKDGRVFWQLKDGPPITATTVDTAFVVATDETLLGSVIAGVGEGNLAAHKEYRAVRAKAGGDDLAMFAFANVPALVAKFGGEMGEEEMAIANHLGLDTVQGLAYGMAFSGDGFMDSLIVHAPGADHGIVPLLSFPKFEARALPFVPANAFYFEEGAYDINALLPRVRKLMEGVEEGASEEMDDALKQMNEAIGVDLEKELLAGMTGAFGTYAAMPETGGLYPEVAMMIQVKDPAAFEAIMARTAKGIAGMVTEEGDVVASTRTLSYQKHNLHLFEMQAARGDDPVPFTPTWTMMDDWCVITLVPHAMKEIILRRGTSTGGGLAGQEDYQALRRVMPADAGTMSYLDLQGILNLVYDTAVPTLQTVAKPNVLGREIPFPLDWAQLPAARTARPYFRSMASYMTWNEDGMAMRMHGPIPVGGLLMLGVGAGAAFFLTAAGSSEMRVVPGGPMMPGEVRRGPNRPGAGGAGGSSEDRLARLQGQQVASYVRVFVLMEKRLPNTLDELVEKEVMGSLPKDPWGNEYRLEVVDAEKKLFKILSNGADGQAGTADDVTAGG